MPVQQTPIITKRHTDSNGNYTTNRIIGEVKQVIKRHILLEEIPHPHLGITIVNTSDNTILKEVDYTEALSNASEYKIDYSEGKVWFYSRLEGKKVSVDYYGLGYDMIHASRVYTQLDINGDVCETLGDILDYAVIIIEELGEIKDAVIRGEKLLEDLYRECENALALLDDLGIKIVEGSELDVILRQTILEANSTKEELSALLLYADDKIDELTKLNAEIGEMIDISNNYHLLEVKNDLQSKIDVINNILEQLQNDGATHDHDILYLRLDGTSTMTGGIALPNGKVQANGEYGINANGSDIINVNTLNFGEGKDLHFVEDKLHIGSNEIWTSENQGEGSGSDADTVDGLHASNLLQLEYTNGFAGMRVNGDDRQPIRTTREGLLPFDSGVSSLGDLSYPFLKAYVKEVSGCSAIHMSKNGGKSRINFEAPFETDKVYIEHNYVGEASSYVVSMGDDNDYNNTFKVGNHTSTGFETKFMVQGDGVTATNGLSISGKRIYIQSTQPTNAPEGSIWFQV